jgi:hypothetical protein
MLSHDIDNAAASINVALAGINEGGRVSRGWLRGLQSNLRAQADQARQLEAQVAPGSPLIDNVVRLAAGKMAATR